MIIASYMASQTHTDYLIIKFILGSRKLQDALAATCTNRTEEVFPELMRDLINVFSLYSSLLYSKNTWLLHFQYIWLRFFDKFD